MVRRTPAFLLILSLLVVLAACAPAAEDGERQAVEQLSDPVGYYPTQTGVRWSYLPNGAQLSDPRVEVTVEGPTVLDGETWIATHMEGRGLDVRWFRQERDDGIYLAREERPGLEIEFDPPLRELPGEGELRTGLTWNGETTASVTFPEATEENRHATRELSYRTTVVDRRTVTVAAGEFEVFVLNFTSRQTDEDGEVVDELTQEFWYAPFVGEVRTENEFYLVDGNFLDAPDEDEDAETADVDAGDD